MYIPPDFEVADSAAVIALIDRFPFGLLVTNEEPYPSLTHLPMIAELRNGELWVLGHVARANGHARSITNHCPATVAFQGAHAYVSASWYEEPYATVPTWNYTAAHLCGTLREGDAWDVLTRLTEKFEGGRADAWDPQRLETDFREKQLRGIVAFEMRAERIYAKAKLSQNRTDADRIRVIRQLSESADVLERECAEDMRRSLGR
ncbi:MAG TPA: FMN-binding negative transcriptional regulator [Candidatus Acidoferrum sp.]|jgi:transcriptional regulator|nr:FMN-binding negative transcriptional regulator [Candidatus Acidoferrum sp.]